MTKSCASCAKRKSALLGLSESTIFVTYTPGYRSIHGINMSERCCGASRSTCPQSIMNGSATSPAGRRDRNPTGVVVVHSDDDGLLGGEIAPPRQATTGHVECAATDIVVEPTKTAVPSDSSSVPRNNQSCDTARLDQCLAGRTNHLGAGDVQALEMGSHGLFSGLNNGLRRFTPGSHLRGGGVGDRIGRSAIRLQMQDL